MRNAIDTHSRRRGFTLIELLVVIAIIGVLMGLVSAGVLSYMRKIPEVETRSEMSQLATALSSFNTKFGRYPPSKIFLANTLAAYTNPNPPATFTFRQESLNTIQQLFPNISWPVNWGPGAATGVILEGDQCLVFFLGGMQTSAGGVNGCLGFSTNPKNPTAAGGTRIDPFFNFDSSRLVIPPDPPTMSGLPKPPAFFVCLDKFRKDVPYAYFSSGNTRNGYQAGDCARLGATNGDPALPLPNRMINPYFEVAGRFHNPNTFQLISAGRDGLFGRGGQWTPAIAGRIPVAGADDFTNFHGSRMDSP